MQGCSGSVLTNARTGALPNARPPWHSIPTHTTGTPSYAHRHARPLLHAQGTRAVIVSATLRTQALTRVLAFVQINAGTAARNDGLAGPNPRATLKQRRRTRTRTHTHTYITRILYVPTTSDLACGAMASASGDPPQVSNTLLCVCASVLGGATLSWHGHPARAAQAGNSMGMSSHCTQAHHCLVRCPFLLPACIYGRRTRPRVFGCVPCQMIWGSRTSR